MINFNGEDRLISVDESYPLAVIYSEWKRWVLDENANYPPAFRELGGDPLGGNISLGVYFFIRNDKGWRIKPTGNNGELIIDGNLYPQDVTQSWTAPADAVDYAYIRLQTSSLTQAIDNEINISDEDIERISAASNLSDEQIAKIALIQCKGEVVSVKQAETVNIKELENNRLNETDTVTFKEVEHCVTQSSEVTTIKRACL